MRGSVDLQYLQKTETRRADNVYTTEFLLHPGHEIREEAPMGLERQKSHTPGYGADGH